MTAYAPRERILVRPLVSGMSVSEEHQAPHFRHAGEHKHVERGFVSTPANMLEGMRYEIIGMLGQHPERVLNSIGTLSVIWLLVLLP